MLRMRGLEPVGSKAGMGPQRLELEMRRSLVRAVSLEWWDWKPDDIKLNREARTCGQCMWTAPGKAGL